MSIPESSIYKIKYPHRVKKIGNKNRIIKKTKNMPLVAIGRKVSEGVCTYFALFCPPRDTLRDHLDKHQKTIFFDIPVITCNIKIENFDTQQLRFKNVGLEFNDCVNFHVFKDTINSIRHPTRGLKHELCGNSDCLETDQSVYFNKRKNLYFCRNCINIFK